MRRVAVHSLAGGNLAAKFATLQLAPLTCAKAQRPASISRTDSAKRGISNGRPDAIEHAHVPQLRSRAACAPASMTHFPIAQSDCQHSMLSLCEQEVVRGCSSVEGEGGRAQRAEKQSRTAHCSIGIASAYLSARTEVGKQDSRTGQDRPRPATRECRPVLGVM